MRVTPEAFVGEERVEKILRWAELIRHHDMCNSIEPATVGLYAATSLMKSAKRVLKGSPTAGALRALKRDVADMEFACEAAEAKRQEHCEMIELGNRIHWRRYSLILFGSVVYGADSPEELLEIIENS